LFASLGPAQEREFLLELRQRVLEAIDRIAPWPQPEVSIDLDGLTGALEPFTLTEKQVAWLDTMRYTPAEIGILLRMARETVEKVEEKTAERIRGQVDAWRRTLLSENGRPLGLAAGAGKTNDCLPSKAFLDVIDGRTTWRGREEMERHVRGCWHCIDHFCRMLEASEFVRTAQPLTDPEARPFRKLLGLDGGGKRPIWKRLFQGA
jgi:hypothetical protein